MIEEVNDNLLISEIHARLELYENSLTDSYYLTNFYLNNEFVSIINELFEANELTIDEIRKCITIIGFSTRVKENSLVKNNEQIKEMFSMEQTTNFDAKKAHILNAKLTLYFNKNNKLYVLK
jgi:hypothetical protein